MTLRPFLFDTCFSQSMPVVSVSVMEKEMAEAFPEAVIADEVPPVLYGEQEMQAAKSVAFEDGRQAGLAEAEAGIVARQQALLQKLPSKFDALMEGQKSLPEYLTNAAIPLAVALVRQIFPHLNQEQRSQQFAAMLEDALASLEAQPRLLAVCHADDVGILEEIWKNSNVAKIFEGRFLIQSKPEMALGDLRLEWSDGGVERLAERLLYKLDTLANRHAPKIIPLQQQEKIP
ncbi:MAG: hypothetical protein ACK48P_04555 [Holosporales bacterium]|jgi:flagellar assembly protein FliH